MMEAQLRGIVQTIQNPDIIVIVEEVMTGPTLAKESNIVFHVQDVEEQVVSSLKEGQTIVVTYDGRTTRSMPPQATAISIDIES